MADGDLSTQFEKISDKGESRGRPTEGGQRADQGPSRSGRRQRA